ncbi:hypothetical protein [Streptomyces fructofermentans]|nr:hypothetical protein [Streptomyces fructofermentans]
MSAMPLVHARTLDRTPGVLGARLARVRTAVRAVSFAPDRREADAARAREPA